MVVWMVRMLVPKRYQHLHTHKSPRERDPMAKTSSMQYILWSLWLTVFLRMGCTGSGEILYQNTQRNSKTQSLSEAKELLSWTGASEESSMALGMRFSTTWNLSWWESPRDEWLSPRLSCLGVKVCVFANQRATEGNLKTYGLFVHLCTYTVTWSLPN